MLCFLFFIAFFTFYFNYMLLYARIALVDLTPERIYI